MIYDEKVSDLLNMADDVANSILKSSIYLKYKQAKNNLNNEETITKKVSFLKAKEKFEKIASYGKYAPNYKENLQQMLEEKKKLDLDRNIADFRKKELELQTMLDDISIYLASIVSNDIKVDVGNPFKNKAKCSGECQNG